VAGTATSSSGGSQFALAEFTSAGALDPSFGNGTGEVLSSFSSTSTLSNDTASALAVGPSGVIYAGGNSDANGKGQDFAVAAYQPDGSLDSSFGSGGKMLLDFSGFDDTIASLALQSNGDLVAAGSSINASGVIQVALARFLPGGQVDPKFGAKGKVLTAVGQVDDQATSVVIDPKGKMIVGGFSASGSVSDGSLTSDFLLVRYNSNGSIDRTFGGGPVRTSFGQPAAVTQVRLESNGEVLVSGKTTASLTSFDPSKLDVAIARYTPQGKPDTTFDATGKAIVSLSAGSVTPAESVEVSGATLAPSTSTDLANFSLASVLTPQDAASNLMQSFQDLVNSSQGTVAITQGGEALVVGNSGANTVAAEIITQGIDLAARLIAKLPPAAVQGAKASLSITISEAGNEAASGTVTIQLYASADGQVDSGLTSFQSVAEKLNLKSNQSRTFVIHYTLNSDGTYYVVADVLEGGSVTDLNPNNNFAASGAQVDVAPAFVQLDASPTLSARRTPAAGKAASLSFGIANDGNVTAKSALIEILASPDGTVASGIQLAEPTLALNLPPGGKSRTYHLIVKIPATLPVGAYTLLAVLDPNNTLSQPTLTNNVLTGPAFTIL
jgi:uncharacterized delta-60 repeat protein